MSQFPLEQRHGEQARELYQLRTRLLDRRMSDSCSLLDLERRLSVHLAILSRMNVEVGAPDGNDTQRLLHFAIALQSVDAQALCDTCRQAFEQLSDDNLDDTPLYDAFALYPPSTDLLLPLYEQTPEAGHGLFSLWRRQGAELPTDLLALRLERPLGMNPRWGWQTLRFDQLEIETKPVAASKGG